MFGKRRPSRVRLLLLLQKQRDRMLPIITCLQKRTLI